MALISFAAPFAMAAEGDRVLDPDLSLIGGCNKETLDPVEDPGCPTTPPPSAHPPSGFFSNPRAVATDFHGDIYVASYGNDEEGTEGRIDIFDPTGVFIDEIDLDEVNPPFGPVSLAIDSKGILYAGLFAADKEIHIFRYTPCVYEPEAGNIEYCNAPVPFGFKINWWTIGLSINRDDDHLFANYREEKVVEYSSAAEGNEVVRTANAGGIGVAVDASRDRLYASFEKLGIRRVDIFDLTKVLGTPPEDEYEKIDSIEASAVPGGSLGNSLSVAVDEATGNVFVSDSENSKLYEFDEDGNYLATINFKIQLNKLGNQIGVDNGPTSPNKGYLYVPSHKTGIGHSFAFKEFHVDPPHVTSLEALNISEDEAELTAQINPGNLPTTYTVEYTTQQSFEAEGFAGATVAAAGELPAGNLNVEVSAPLTGLAAGTSYRFRVFAENEEGSDEEEVSFATYPSFPVNTLPCANALFRIGPSALLPDCRAYELVTPPDTNGRVLIGTGTFGNVFTNRQVSPDGEKLPFKVEGGSLPGYGGTGSSLGDPYLATRTEAGWQTTYIGPSGAETSKLLPGTASPDQGYSFWRAEGTGTAFLGVDTTYVRFPDGHSELLGQGTLGIEPEAEGQLISEGGSHIIFVTGALLNEAVQLEPNAAPDGTRAIYDRVPNPETGVRETKVISLKPGNEPFGAGEDALYLGASLDGEGVAFTVDGTLYLRYRNEETFEIGTGVDFAGFAEGGARIFYVEAGDLKAFDVGTEEVIEFTATGDVDPVFVALGGTAAYFISETAIPGSGPNPEGDQPQAGEKNLYLSEEGQEISFVATVTDRDAEGKLITGIGNVDGLGIWVEAAVAGRYGIVAARATPDGGVLLFKSRAKLTDYDPGESAQIYRYDSGAAELQCLSCNPTGAPSDTDATLQSERRTQIVPLFSPFVWIENLRADGKRAFFESSEPLVAGDSDDLQDIYEWEAEGVGGCTAPAPQGCLYLISSANSLRPEFLWAVSPSGEDVFFVSSELLVGSDADNTGSIYDARVGGGFPETSPGICVGEACHPQLTPPPLLPGTHTPVQGTSVKRRHCPKGKRKVKRAGKVRCVKKHKHRHHKGGHR